MKMRDYIRQGKSENYQDAEEKGLLKAGEAAVLLSKKLGMKVSAAELTVFATEWHHAGVFKSSSGASLRGRKVYFFSPAAVEKITAAQLLANREKAAAKPAPDQRTVQGWYPQYFRTTDPVSRRMVNKAFIGIYSGPAHKAPKGFTPLDAAAFANAEQRRGRELKPGERPSF
ncbi:hypothetical protein ECE50_012180 [Chitinophaga sp. Mgbs1]|uniref:Uncharacterized protein n=1 Tax=Chitinophaga solisilvae TaxID=1233460 RepID=A0A3S1CXB9_9BACT|nr:hypothetical protein [Chitinophaga solisilvae]